MEYSNRIFWNWRTVKDSADERELIIDGTIAAEQWWDDDITPAMFKRDLLSGKGPITVWINSPGGDCFAASQIYTMLREYPGNVTVKIDGIAASAASVIAMAGSKVLMSPTSMLMIHNPATCACGQADEMQKAIEMLDEVKESIINAYEIKTGMQRARISRMMDAETWMNARKAIELGFADGMLEDKSGTSSDGFAFEARTNQNAIMAKAVAIAKASAPVTPTGKTIDELMKELKNKK